MNDQLGLLLRGEGLGQNNWSGWFRGPLKELSNLGASWKILHVVIITTDKTRVSRFALIPIVNRWSFGSLCLRSVFVLLILTLSFSGFVLTCNTLFPPVCKNNYTGQELWQTQKNLNV
jgi:hypothetical protein